MGIRSVMCISLVLFAIHVDARVRDTNNNQFLDSQTPKIDFCERNYARCTVDFGISFHASYKGLHTSDTDAEDATWNEYGGYESAKPGEVKYGPDDIVEISEEPIGISAYLQLYKVFGVRVDYLYNQYRVKDDIFTEESPIKEWKINNEMLITSFMLSMYISDDRVDQDITDGTLLYLLLGRAYVWRTDEVTAKEGVYIQGTPKLMEDSSGFLFGLGLIQRFNSFVGLELEIGVDTFDFKPIGAFDVPDIELATDGGLYVKIGLAGFWAVEL